LVGEGYYDIVQDDLLDAFPSVRIDLALAAYRQHLHDDNLVRLIETILRGHDGDRHTVGLDQGCPLSPVSLNIFLDHFLDRPYSADPDLPRWHRYVDNIVYQCQRVSEGRRALRRARELLSQIGMVTKGQDGPPVRLLRQGAGIEILGFHLTREGNRAVLWLGRKAWTKLAQELEGAHTAPCPATRAKNTIRGWLMAFAPGLENADAQEVLWWIHRVAAQAGFRELVKDRAKLASQLGEAVRQWQALSGQAREPSGDVSSCIGS
jgi:hypothetical protein